MGNYRFAAIVLIFALSISLMSCTATAATVDSVFVGGVELKDKAYLPTGGSLPQLTCPSGGYAYYEDGVLTLKDYTYEGTGLYNEEYDDYSGIFAEGDLTIRVMGENLIDVTSAGEKDSYAIMADTLTIEAGPYDCLTAWGTYCGIITLGETPLMTLKGGTVYGYGDSWGAVADITVEEGAMILSNGDYSDDIYEGETSYGAMYGTLTIASNLYAYGSEDPEGSTLTAYTAENGAAYDYISVEGQSIFVAGVEMINRTYLPIGATELQYDLPTGGYAFYANGFLYLKDFSYEGPGYYDSTWEDYSGISSEIPLTIDLEGENSLTATGQGTAVSYGLAAASLVIRGDQDSSLFLSGNYAGINTTSETPTMVIEGGAIHSVGDYWGAIADITLNGGTLILQNRDINEELYYENTSYSALYGTLEGDPSVEILGSPDPEGKDLVPYVQADQDLYDYIRMAPKAPEAVTDSNLRFNHTIDLASDISINFAIAKSLLTDYDMDSAYVECTVTDYSGGITTTVLEPVLRENYYYFTFTGLNAVRMNDAVTARFVGVKNGVLYCSTEDVYSVASYGYSQLNKTSSSQKLKVLCANLLRYGAMAQQYKGYRTDALADSAMTEEHKSLLTDLSTVTFDSVNQTVEPLSQATVTWAGKSLNLDSKVTIKYIVNLSNYTGSKEDLHLRLEYTAIDGTARNVRVTDLAPYDESRNYYAFDFNGLLAAELRQTVRAAVYEGEQRLSDVLEYSASTYGKNKTGSLLELCKCLMAYSDGAKAYFS